jgi:hypothetical protein
MLGHYDLFNILFKQPHHPAILLDIFDSTCKKLNAATVCFLN